MVINKINIPRAAININIIAIWFSLTNVVVAAEVGGESEIKQANISMLVLKKETRTYNAHGYGAGVSHWDSGAGVSVALPDQSRWSLYFRYSCNILPFLRISVTGENDTISVSFTSYTNLGSMMSDNNTGAVIRSDIYWAECARLCFAVYLQS